MIRGLVSVLFCENEQDIDKESSFAGKKDLHSTQGS